MRSAGACGLLVVIFYTTLVSSTSVEQIIESECNSGSSELCKILSSIPDGGPPEDYAELLAGDLEQQTDQLSCATCSKLMLSFKEKFESTTRGELVEIMLNTCYSIPSLSEACVNIVSSYFDEFYELTRAQLQSNELCQLVSDCPSSSAELELDAAPITKNSHCDQCKHFVEHLKEKFLRNSTETQFKERLNAVCHSTIVFKAECLQLVDQYYHVMYDLLHNKMSADEICHKFAFCPKKEEVEEQGLELFEYDSAPETESDLRIAGSCTACKIAFRLGKRTIKDHITDAELMKAMHRICNKIKNRKWADKCHNGVNRHGKGLAHFVRNPRVICSMLGLCLPIADDQVELLDSSNSEELQSLVTDLRQSKKCHLCNHVISSLRKLMEQSQDITLALNQVCQELHNEEQKRHCEQMIEEHSSLIKELVRKGAPHQQICRTLNMCLLYERVDFLEIETDSLLDETTLENRLTKGGPKCTVCKLLIKALREVAGHANDRGSIARGLQRACHKLGKLKSRCDKMVQEHGNQIVDLMVKKTSDRLICKLIVVCRAHLEENEEEPIEGGSQFMIDEDEYEDDLDFLEAEPVLDETRLENPLTKGGPKCTVCKLLIKALRGIVGHANDRGSIARGLQRACHKLGKLKGRCDRLVQKHGNQIIDLMVKKSSDRLICKLIGVCRAHLEEDEEEERLGDQDEFPIENEQFENDSGLEEADEQELESRHSTNCTICKIAMKHLSKIVKRNSSREEITKALGTVCQHLGNMHSHCEGIIKSHGEQIVNLMMNHTCPKAICGLIHVCHRPKEFNAERDLATGNEPSCAGCKWAVNKVKNLIDTKRKRDQLMFHGQQACQVLPHSIRDSCNVIIGDFIEFNLNAFLTLTPHETCKLLQLCWTEEEYLDFIEHLDMLFEQNAEENQFGGVEKHHECRGPLCMVCKVLFNEFERLLNTPEKRERILRSMLFTCDILPHRIHHACQNAIHAYGAAVLDLLSKVEPMDVCGVVPFVSLQMVEE